MQPAAASLGLCCAQCERLGVICENRDQCCATRVRKPKAGSDLWCGVERRECSVEDFNKKQFKNRAPGRAKSAWSNRLNVPFGSVDCVCLIPGALLLQTVLFSCRQANQFETPQKVSTFSFPQKSDNYSWPWSADAAAKRAAIKVVQSGAGPRHLFMLIKQCLWGDNKKVQLRVKLPRLLSGCGCLVYVQKT